MGRAHVRAHIPALITGEPRYDLRHSIAGTIGRRCKLKPPEHLIHLRRWHTAVSARPSTIEGQNGCQQNANYRHGARTRETLELWKLIKWLR